MSLRGDEQCRFTPRYCPAHLNRAANSRSDVLADSNVPTGSYPRIESPYPTPVLHREESGELTRYPKCASTDGWGHCFDLCLFVYSFFRNAVYRRYVISSFRPCPPCWWGKHARYRLHAKVEGLDELSLRCGPSVLCWVSAHVVIWFVVLICTSALLCCRMKVSGTSFMYYLRRVPWESAGSDTGTAYPGRGTPGYSRVVEGTFRDRFPSQAFVDDSGRAFAGTFDHVYVITRSACPSQQESFEHHARSVGLRYTLVAASTVVDRSPALLPLSPGMRRRSASSLSAHEAVLRHLRLTSAHRRIWDNVIASRRQRVLVLDSSVFPSRRLIRMLPYMLDSIDVESVAGEKPWHMVTFRRKRLAGGNATERIWLPESGLGTPVYTASPSLSSGMYALSLGGARFLTAHITQLRAPLAAELALLQTGGLTVLSPCGGAARAWCAELVAPVAGGSEYDCAWARMQEAKLPASVEELARYR